MAKRQGTRSTPKSSASPAAGSMEQVTSAANENAADVEDSAVLRAAFDTTPFEGDAAAADTSDAPQARFVGEQLIYKDRYERIAEAAYLRAEQRGFETGHEVADWLAAEKEIDALLSGDAGSFDSNS